MSFTDQILFQLWKVKASDAEASYLLAERDCASEDFH